MSSVIFKRKVLKVGDSLGITIPEDVCTSYEIKKGQVIYLVIGTIDGYLLVDLQHKKIGEILKEIKDPTSL